MQLLLICVALWIKCVSLLLTNSSHLSDGWSFLSMDGVIASSSFLLVMPLSHHLLWWASLLLWVPWMGPHREHHDTTIACMYWWVQFKTSNNGSILCCVMTQDWYLELRWVHFLIGSSATTCHHCQMLLDTSAETLQSTSLMDDDGKLLSLQLHWRVWRVTPSKTKVTILYP